MVKPTPFTLKEMKKACEEAVRIDRERILDGLKGIACSKDETLRLLIEDKL